jgi:hypothetical protein
MLWKPYNAYINTHTHTHIYIYVYIYIHTYIHTYVRTYVHTCIHTYIHSMPLIHEFFTKTIGCGRSHKYTNIYIYIYIYIYIHIYIHTYIQQLKCKILNCQNLGIVVCIPFVVGDTEDKCSLLLATYIVSVVVLYLF